MLSSSSGISVSPVDPHTLSESEITRIHEVTQDMWADGIGEFMQCRSCSYMHSKWDIYGHLSEEKYQDTVCSLLQKYPIPLSCRVCGGDTHFVYGEENIDTIRDRLLSTKKSFLVVARNRIGEIIGYEDAYIDTLESIYEREFETHYRDIGMREIAKRIEEVLGYHSDEFLVLSDIRFLRGYRTFQNIFSVLRSIASTMTAEYDAYPGFTEIDKKSPLHRISHMFGGVSIGILSDPALAVKIANTGRDYTSDLLVSHGLTRIYREAFSGRARDLLRRMRQS